MIQRTSAQRNLLAFLAGVLFSFSASSADLPLAWRDLFNYGSPSAFKVEIDANILGECLAQQTKKTNYYFNRNDLDKDSGFQKFVDYLGAAPGREVDFATGNEARLRNWVLLQNQNSIDPLMIYSESLRLNQGNVFDAVLTVHQLLRNEARFFDQRRYSYQSNLENYKSFYDRFIDLRGDLVELGPGFKGDHAGTWYRIWGTVLYEMLWIPGHLDNAQSLTTKQQVSLNFGHYNGKIVSQYVELSKLISSPEFDRTGKMKINQIAADTARKLINSLWGAKKNNLTVSSESQFQSACQQRAYLKVSTKNSTVSDENNLSTKALPQVSLEEQMSPTLLQTGGTCYSYAFTAAVEAALYRADQKHRKISPEFLLSRVFASQSVDPARLIKSILGSKYADGHLGANQSNMFQLLAKETFQNTTYIEDFYFRALYEAAMNNIPSLSVAESLRYIANPTTKNTPAVFGIFKKLYANRIGSETKEPLLRNLRLETLWTRDANEDSGVIPVLAKTMLARVPPIIIFTYSLEKTQVSRNGGKTWTPLASPLFALPVWHAVVLQKITTDKLTGESYMVFRDSFEFGNETTPSMSQIRIRVRDAVNLINQVMTVKGTWDQP